MEITLTSMLENSNEIMEAFCHSEWIGGGKAHMAWLLDAVNIRGIHHFKLFFVPDARYPDIAKSTAISHQVVRGNKISMAFN